MSRADAAGKSPASLSLRPLFRHSQFPGCTQHTDGSRLDWFGADLIVPRPGWEEGKREREEVSRSRDLLLPRFFLLVPPSLLGPIAAACLEMEYSLAFSPFSPFSAWQPLARVPRSSWWGCAVQLSALFFPTVCLCVYHATHSGVVVVGRRQFCGLGPGRLWKGLS